MRVGITGAGGFLGSALGRALRDDGHDVIPFVRPGARASGIAWDPAGGTLDREALAGLDAIVNLAGEPIGTKRWTRAQKDRIYQSRVGGTALLARALADMGDRRPGVLVNASAVGFYGDRDTLVLDEASGRGSGFLSDTCVDWEAATRPASEAGVRVAMVRTGLVLHPDGGLLKTMLLPFKLGLGARLGSGLQYQSWITREDHVRAMMHVLTGDVDGPVNLVGPAPVTNVEFTRILASVLRRPAFLVVPRALIALVLGGELAADLLASQRVRPAALVASGFSFHHEDLEVGLRSVLGA